MADKFVNGGLAIWTNRDAGAGTEDKYLGWGTGATAPAVANTDLTTAATEARTTGTSSRVTTTATNDTHRVVGTITADGTKGIQEVGRFDGAGSSSPPSGANLSTHSTFSVINVVLNNSITFTVDLVISNGS